MAENHGEERIEDNPLHLASSSSLSSSTTHRYSSRKFVMCCSAYYPTFVLSLSFPFPSSTPPPSFLPFQTMGLFQSFHLSSLQHLDPVHYQESKYKRVIHVRSRIDGRSVLLADRVRHHGLPETSRQRGRKIGMGEDRTPNFLHPSISPFVSFVFLFFC